MVHQAYIRHTKGKTAVLFIHGFLGSPNHFEKFIDVVPKDYAVYNILLKGHGGSVIDFGKASMEKWKNQVSDVVTELLQKYENIIICAHSMGTFFAVNESLKHPDSIKSLFLLAVPLKIAVKSTAALNTLKVLFNIIPKDDKKGQAYKNTHSVKLNMKLWEYVGWVPRYLELFAESERCRENILKVSVPCKILFSKKDELVSFKSKKYATKNKIIDILALPNSAHFIYNESDYDYMLNEFKKSF